MYCDLFLRQHVKKILFFGMKLSLKLFSSFDTTVLRTVSFPSRSLDRRNLNHLSWVRVSFTRWSSLNENADLCITFKLLHNRIFTSISFPHVTNIEYCIIVIHDNDNVFQTLKYLCLTYRIPRSQWFLRTFVWLGSDHQTISE